MIVYIDKSKHLINQCLKKKDSKVGIETIYLYSQSIVIIHSPLLETCQPIMEMKVYLLLTANRMHGQEV